MFNFTDNRKTINEITRMFNEKTLIVDDTYQRRSVWSEKDKVRLIETVLLSLIMPPLFFWKAQTDPDTGESITHIVDGQQRIKAIYSFVSNEFRLKPQYLLDSTIRDQYANNAFEDFDSSVKKSFWNYQLMIIEIDQRATRTDIIRMFNRLNLTDYNLNDQEKRNSMSGEFAVLARELSENEIWEKYRLFTNADVRRMKDVEFCATIVLLSRKGIIDQTDQSALNQAYEDLQVGYKDAEQDKEAVNSAINTLAAFFATTEIEKFLRRKAQLYTLFSVIFYMQREKLSISEQLCTNLDRFVKAYSVFSNDMDITGEMNDDEKILFDWLKKYKLASSEGLNKHVNRMIRFNVMKDFLFNLSPQLSMALETLKPKMIAFSSTDQIEDPEE